MNKIFNILVVEDNMADYLLIEDAFKQIQNILIKIHHVTDGQKAIDFMFKQNEFQDAVDVNLVMLDLNLPVLNGLQVLKQLKEDECIKVIPVIIYTTSEENVDIISSYSCHANSYITKAFEIEEVFKKIKKLGEYWLTTSKLPNNEWF